mgnify:CR=1 FL=1
MNASSSPVRRPVLALTQGDPAGIGPEILLKLLQEDPTPAGWQPLLVAERAEATAGIAVVQSSLVLVDLAVRSLMDEYGLSREGALRFLQTQAVHHELDLVEPHAQRELQALAHGELVLHENALARDVLVLIESECALHPVQVVVAASLVGMTKAQVTSPLKCAPLPPAPSVPFTPSSPTVPAKRSKTSPSMALPSAARIVVRPLTPARWADLEAVFDADHLMPVGGEQLLEEGAVLHVRRPRSERQLRIIDHDQDGSMELKKREGYF